MRSEAIDAGEVVNGHARRVRPRLRRASAVSIALTVAAVVVVAIIPLVNSGYLLFQLALVFLYIAAGSGLNIAVGYSGEFLLSQAPAMGVAAYTAGVLSLQHSWSPWAALPFAVIGAAAWQLVIGLPGLRVKGLYLGLLSFFAVLVFSDVVLMFPSTTGGDQGLIGVPSFGTLEEGYEVCAGVLGVCLLLAWLFVRTGWGVRLKYLRDAPNALASVGINAWTTKITTYIVSAIPAGLAGWALAYIDQSVTSSVFGIALTLVLFAGVQLVAPGTLLGPIVGVGLLEGYSLIVGPFNQYNTLGLGLILAVVVILIPGGLTKGLRTLVQFATASRLGKSLNQRVTQGRSDSGPVADPATPSGAASAVRLSLELADFGTVAQPADLSLRGISKSFGGNHAVSEVSLEVGSGRVMALMGENGSGKTTLANLASGAVRADDGEVWVGDTDVTALNAAAVARCGISRTFQIPQLVDELSVVQNVAIALHTTIDIGPFRAVFLPFSSAKRARRRLDEARRVCTQIGFSAAELDLPVDLLALGLRRIVEVARAAATAAPVVILDEPTAGLNEEEMGDLSLVLKALRRSGRAILLVEHNVKFVLSTCDDVVLLRAGKIAGLYRDIDADRFPDELSQHLLRSSSVEGV